MGKRKAIQNRFWLIKQYFNQPVFSKKATLTLNFFRFVRLQRVYYLERCLKQQYSIVRFYPLLEKCWAQS